MTTATQSAATPAAQQFTTTYPALETVSKPNLTTAEAAHFLNRAPQTLRAWACLENGPIRPRRVGGLLAWNTNEVKSLAGIDQRQKGFSTLRYLAYVIGVAVLLQAILAVFPGFIASLDWAGVAMLGAGVISRDYSDLSALVKAASKQDCTVHLHVNDQGRNVFSVGNSNIGAAEFGCYFDALAYLSARNHTAADCAEQAGSAIAQNAMDDMLNSNTQAERFVILLEGLQSLATMPHHDRAAAGFALALVNVIEIGLKNLPKVA